MDTLLTALRACAEPTRLRLLALAARGAFCVVEFTEILGQSQPRLSRHLRLLGEAGLLEREREGANVWFAVPGADTAPDIRARAAHLLADVENRERGDTDKAAAWLQLALEIRGDAARDIAKPKSVAELLAHA